MMSLFNTAAKQVRSGDVAKHHSFNLIHSKIATGQIRENWDGLHGTEE